MLMTSVLCAAFSLEIETLDIGLRPTQLGTDHSICSGKEATSTSTTTNTKLARRTAAKAAIVAAKAEAAAAQAVLKAAE